MVRDMNFRLHEFLRRLADAPKVETYEAALALIVGTLDAVEDELSGVPYNPEQWRTDGRMYGPQVDNVRDVPGHPLVKRARSKKHHTFIGVNGAIEIRDLDGNVVFGKQGKDGRAIRDL